MKSEHKTKNKTRRKKNATQKNGVPRFFRETPFDLALFNYINLSAVVFSCKIFVKFCSLSKLQVPLYPSTSQKSRIIEKRLTDFENHFSISTIYRKNSIAAYEMDFAVSVAGRLTKSHQITHNDRYVLPQHQ